MVSIRGLKPGAVAGVDAEDQEQWRQTNTMRESLLLLLLPAVTCWVCSLAVHTGQQKLLTLLHPYLPQVCYTFTACEQACDVQLSLLQRHRLQSVGVSQGIQLEV